MNLPPNIANALRGALNDAFTDNGDLNLLARELGWNPDQVFEPSAKAPQRIDHLIQLAEENDKVFALVINARVHRPENNLLLHFADSYLNDVARAMGEAPREDEEVVMYGPGPRGRKPGRRAPLRAAIFGLVGATVMALATGLLWAESAEDREARRVLDNVKSYRPLDSTLLQDWTTTKEEMAKKWRHVSGDAKEIGFRVLKLGPYQAHVGPQSVHLLFAASCKVRFQVFHKKYGSDKPETPPEPDLGSNPCKVDLPDCGTGDTVFLLVSLRPTCVKKGCEAEDCGIQAPNADDAKAWLSFTRIRRLP